MSDQQPHHRGPDGYATYNLVAEYADGASARKAILALERHGVEAGRFTLSGSDMEHSSQESNDELYEKDWGTVSHVGNRALLGAAIGALVGAVVGAIIATIFSDASSAWMIGALAGAAGGGAIGGFWGGAVAVPVSGEAFEETYDRSSQGGATLVVHTDDQAEMERAAAAIDGTGATRVQRVGRDGRPVAS